ncbi:MAG: hypothetical protein ABI947_11120 [Chloroflexota bacterium]
MANNDAVRLGDLDGSDAIYPPFNRVFPYPKFLVINIYGGYTLLSGKSICITHPDQLLVAQRLQSALAQIGIEWGIKVQSANQGRENVGVQFEIKPLEYGIDAYEVEIEIYSPYQNHYKNGIISLLATNLPSLENGVGTLIQVIQLAFEEFEEDIPSLWIRDWMDTSYSAG